MTPAVRSDSQLERLYLRAERRHQRLLPPEHYMEATDHSRQREITLESFALVYAMRPDIQCFNELLVLYPKETGHRRIAGVVPDNMVVVSREPVQAVGSFSIPLQPVGPLLVLEYVSRHNQRKDYEDNLRRYESDLRIPYYLLFYPGKQELTLYRMAEEKYEAVAANAAGRVAVPELELEAGLLDGWVRYWFRGGLLPLPGEMLQSLSAQKQQLSDQQRQLADAAGEIARLREELARAKALKPD